MKNRIFIIFLTAGSIYLSSSTLMANANECIQVYGGGKSMLKAIAAQIEIIDPNVKLTTSQILSDVKIIKLISSANSQGISTAQVKSLINTRIEQAKKPFVVTINKTADRPAPHETQVKKDQINPPIKPKPRKVLVEGAEVENDISNLTRLNPDFVEVNPSLVFSRMPDRVAAFFTFDINGRLIPAYNPFPFQEKEIADVRPGFNGGVILQVETGNEQYIVVQSGNRFVKSKVYIDTLVESMRGQSHISKLTALANGLVAVSMVHGKIRIYSPLTDSITENFQRREWSPYARENLNSIHPIPNGDFIAHHTITNYEKQKLNMYNDNVIQYWHFDTKTHQYEQAGHITDSATTEIVDVHRDGHGMIYALYRTGEVKTFVIKPIPPKPQESHGGGLFSFLKKKPPAPLTPPDLFEFIEIDSCHHAQTIRSASKLTPTPDAGFAISTFEQGVIFLDKDFNGKLQYKSTSSTRAQHFAKYYGFSNGTRVIVNAQYASSNFISTEWSKSKLEVGILDEENP
ncbi:MAG: hypothetical protein J0M15_01500 [Deltaproteobacteria bacterium]|nr:hypothetical protein [Deltaproteobacteria bacterium]